jgi:hypothetical protein
MVKTGDTGVRGLLKIIIELRYEAIISINCTHLVLVIAFHHSAVSIGGTSLWPLQYLSLILQDLHIMPTNFLCTFFTSCVLLYAKDTMSILPAGISGKYPYLKLNTSFS